MLTLTIDTVRRLLVPRRRAARKDSFRSGADLIFRLKAWPDLPEYGRTAEVYRMLSVMSSQPVSRQWLLARCAMAPRELDHLMRQLVTSGAVEVIDPAGFADREPRRA